MTKQKLLDFWKNIYDTQFAKVVKEIEGDDYFSSTHGNMSYLLQENFSEEELEELSASERAEAEDTAVEDWLRDRWSEFESEFEDKAEEQDGMLLGRRCLSVDDAEEFLFFVANETPMPEYTGLGVYWSWDKAQAEAHWGKGGESVLVDALIPFESIDPYVMLTQNLIPSTGEDEAEINLKEGSKIFVTHVEIEGGGYGKNDRVDAPHPIQMTASFYTQYPTLSKILLS